MPAAAALVVGEVIAVGIFLTPAGMTRSLGSPFWLLVVWLLMGAMALCGALCYGELAARFPFAGGGYVYLRESYGASVAFLYGWMALLVLDPGLTAAFAVGLSSYAGYVVSLTPLATKFVGIGSILCLAALNIVGVRVGVVVMQTLAVLKLGLLALIAVWGFADGRRRIIRHRRFAQPHPRSPAPRFRHLRRADVARPPALAARARDDHHGRLRH
ncbi:MAG: amino acid permease [Pyrinomonadaceae bacterium]